jgi:hypothetical protein
MDSKQFVRQGNYINLKTVEALAPDERTFVILGEGAEKLFTNDGVTEQKLAIPVSHTTTKTTYEWSLGNKAIQALADELKTYDTKLWVGAVIKLLVVQLPKGAKTVTATVLQKP